MLPDYFLNPRSIAVIGASEGSAKIGGKIMATLISCGYEGRLLPINPRGGLLHGLPAFRSIAEAPGPIDLALIAVPAPIVAQAVAECAAAGIAGAIVFSSGFGEAGAEGAALQRDLRAVIERTGIRVAGPNAEGFFNIRAKIAPTFSPAVHVKSIAGPLGRDISVVAQSGGLGFALFNRGAAQGLSFGTIVSVGNQVDLDLAAFAHHLIEDEGTAALLLYLESFTRPDAFLAMAKEAARRGKPVILGKAGRSDAGRRAAASHTGALGGEDAACDAMLTRHGVLRGDDQDELLDIAAGLVKHSLPAGRRVAVISPSGGTGVWLADACARFGLEVPEIDPERQARLRAIMPAYGSPVNPVDLTGQGAGGGQGAASFVDALNILYDAPYLDAFILAGSFAHEARLKREGEAIRDFARGPKPVLLHSYTLVSDASSSILEGLGLHCFATGSGTVRALASMAQYHDFLETTRPALLAPPKPLTLAPEAAAMMKGRQGMLAEYEAKALLRAAGIAMPRDIIARNAAEAAVAQTAFGVPVALKIQSPDIPHKTEAGGVALNIQDAAAASAAFDRIMAASREYAPEADLHGVLVQPMAAPGIEMILGVTRDRDFGATLMVGFGGVHVEVLRDIVFAPAPVSPSEAHAMLRRLRAFPLLEGVRGGAAADIDALVALITHVSEIAAAMGENLQELDLNPVLVHPDGQGCSLLDALILLSSETEEAA
ncbi:MAG: acetate--CoA ligase family protein [Roseomonas sp.]|nr:acetate--CoA ligase family protein [Roseomonas sp.]MCA3291951.1 acetate--CoA ligase family protein [Roseomonas sp.]MCA3293666.1 acetate--CoA ligase family protein [Roseomonas sp.]